MSIRNILSAITRDVENSVHQRLLTYTFTKFGRGRLNIGGDRHARLYGVKNLFIHRIATVKTTQDGRSSGWVLTQ